MKSSMTISVDTEVKNKFKTFLRHRNMTTSGFFNRYFDYLLNEKSSYQEFDFENGIKPREILDQYYKAY